MVPPLLRYYQALRLPAALPRRFVAFAPRYRRCALGFAPAGARRSTHRPGVVHRTPHNRFFRRKRQDLPGSWRTLYERAMLSDPGGTSALGHYRASVLSSANWTASTPTTNTNFGAQSHGPHTRCLRFAGWITPPPRKTRFRMAGQPFRAGLITRWVPAKGFRSSHPPFPSFTWRTQFKASKWAKSEYRNHCTW